MPPDAEAVTVIVEPRVIVKAESFEVFLSSLLVTFTVKVFLAIAPALSLTFASISYVSAAAGVTFTVLFVP